MTTPTPPPGRRDNGLPCSDWGALVDLDPRLSEALLSSLADAGVAAYVEPAGGQHALTRASQLPARPLDRLWVDPVRADTARAVVFAEVTELTTLLAEQEPGATAHGLVQPVPRSGTHRVLAPPELPGPPRTDSAAAQDDAGPSAAGPGAAAREPEGPSPQDPDAAWHQIVADYHRQDASPVAPWPVSEDLDPPPTSRRPAARPEGSAEPRRRRGDQEALPAWVEPEAVEPDAAGGSDDGDHYVPPPPPPVPRLAPRKLVGVAAMLLGLVLLFRPSVLGLFQLSPAAVFVVGLAGILGGAATLVLLMRDAPPTDSGPDDGAVV